MCKYVLFYTLLREPLSFLINRIQNRVTAKTIVRYCSELQYQVASSVDYFFKAVVVLLFSPGMYACDEKARGAVV